MRTPGKYTPDTWVTIRVERGQASSYHGQGRIRMIKLKVLDELPEGPLLDLRVKDLKMDVYTVNRHFTLN